VEPKELFEAWCYGHREIFGPVDLTWETLSSKEQALWTHVADFLETKANPIKASEVKPNEYPYPMHKGSVEFFGKFSWYCLECFASGSHPCKVAPVEHRIGDQTALEPMP